ncbi:aromatic acid exporter family protein [Aquibacillus koreensis]|uniref:Aromatic acid exporter family protein n=1 Tax=Aquibacillus koreensis TaxID=279446 RepID=A0A9X4AKQ7_9BACI|nr:aromatic acid exporter family protein [Aquibacillus koreensis]MCT2534368.1 aromatic acid exporter family protein [Aquibacillus koreensis]MDC3421675.1 aromatic acid exporter family protein [Aquibacillus koreensis]
MKLGARMLKTGLAVAIALYAATLLGFPSPVFAGIAAVFAIQPSIYRSFQTIIEQIQANIIGVGTAMLIVFTLGNDPFVIGFTTILVIGICMYLKMTETIPLAIVAVIAVMDSTQMTFTTFALLRFSALTLGIFSAFLVNLLFLPPKYETKLFHKVDQTTSDILQWLRVTTRHLSDFPSLKGEITRIQEDLKKIDQIYLLFSEERTYLKKNRLIKARKLIVFRQLIATANKSFDVLKAFHQLDEKIESIPTKLQAALIEEVDKVIHSHERLLLSSMGRIKKQQQESLLTIAEPDIPRVVEALIIDYKEDDDNSLTFLPLAAQLMEYQHELAHLQVLLKSYQQYHEDEHLEFTKNE